MNDRVAVPEPVGGWQEPWPRAFEIAAVLTRLGYTVDDSTKLTYRFLREAQRIDLMVAEHERPAPRHSRRDVMAVTGGRQALSRVEPVCFEVGASGAVLPVPSIHGALVLKAAAYTVDSRDRDRHLEDAITLFACIVDIAPILGDLQGSDRKRILRVIRALDEQPLVAARVPSDTLRLTQRTIEEFRSAFG